MYTTNGVIALNLERPMHCICRVYNWFAKMIARIHGIGKLQSGLFKISRACDSRI